MSLVPYNTSARDEGDGGSEWRGRERRRRDSRSPSPRDRSSSPKRRYYDRWNGGRRDQSYERDRNREERNYRYHDREERGRRYYDRDERRYEKERDQRYCYKKRDRMDVESDEHRTDRWDEHQHEEEDYRNGERERQCEKHNAFVDGDGNECGEDGYTVLSTTMYGAPQNNTNGRRTKWVFPRMNVSDRNVKVSDKVWRVMMSAVVGVCQTVEHDTIFNFAKNKLWSSICPLGIDLSFGMGNGVTARPHPFFKDVILNGVWLLEMRSMFFSLLTVGYAVVVYGADTDQKNEKTPRVLDPLDYILEWTVDENEKRHYTPRPIPGHSCLCNDKGEFKHWSFFYVAEPHWNGDLRSRARACQKDMVFLSQTTDNYVLIDHAKTNPPMVVETTLEKQLSSLSTLGHKSYADTTMLPPFITGAQTTQQQLASSGGGGGDGMGMAKFGDPLRGDCSQTRSVSSAERTLGLTLFEHASLMGMKTRLAKDGVLSAHADASQRANITWLRVVDPRTGCVMRVSPETMWQRSLLPLPPGSSVADMHMPEPPAGYVDVTQLKISVVCGVLGVPHDLLLGASGGGSRVSTSSITQEDLRANVENWRSTLERFMRAMYWDIYGDYHLEMVSKEDANGNEWSQEETLEKYRSIEVSFKFRDNNDRYQDLKQLYADGIVSGRRLAKAAIDEYGLDPEDVLIPPNRVPDQGREIERSGEWKNYQDTGQMGDIGIGDTGSIGFSKYERKPTSVEVPKV
jgi:hypothetical protein